MCLDQSRNEKKDNPASNIIKSVVFISIIGMEKRIYINFPVIYGSTMKRLPRNFSDISLKLSQFLLKTVGGWITINKAELKKNQYVVHCRISMLRILISQLERF